MGFKKPKIRTKEPLRYQDTIKRGPWNVPEHWYGRPSKDWVPTGRKHHYETLRNNA